MNAGNKPPVAPPVVGSVSAPAKDRSWGGFWRAVIALVIGFFLPMMACFGLVAVSIVSLQAASFAALPSGTTAFGGPVAGPAVATIPIQGLLVTDSESVGYSSSTSSRDVLDLLDQAAADPEVKAIVLVVNSPGGSVVASDLIHHALEEFEKPVVVVMEEVAASGGYYISAGADYIIANQNTLTGSIGVISEFPNAAGLLEKVGVDFIVITSGPRKDFGSPYREMTAAERKYWQAMVDEIYLRFLVIVARGRGLTVEEVHRLADGSVYTGAQALKLGLIDALGYEDDAITKAAALGGIDGEPRVIEYGLPVGLFDLFRYALRRGTLPDMSEILTWMGHPSMEAAWLGP